MKEKDDADPGPVPTEQPTLFPELIEHKIQISEGRYFKARGFTDKPRLDLVLIEGTHETLLTTATVTDAINLAWLIEHVARQLGTANGRYREAHAVPPEEGT